eukprot:scaffold259102_cov21-Tisochrysis_lutea.AAC.2
MMYQSVKKSPYRDVPLYQTLILVYRCVKCNPAVPAQGHEPAGRVQACQDRRLHVQAALLSHGQHAAICATPASRRGHHGSAK